MIHHHGLLKIKFICKYAYIYIYIYMMYTNQINQCLVSNSVNQLNVSGSWCRSHRAL